MEWAPSYTFSACEPEMTVILLGAAEKVMWAEERL